MSSVTLTRYYAAVDAGDLDGAMALLAPDVRSAILLPGRTVRGEDRQALRDYLTGRGDVVRRHVPLRQTTDGDLEFVYGKVVEDEGTTTGYFLASVRIDDAGLIAAYQVAFDTELSLLPDA